MGTANVAALEIYNNAHDITKAINTIVKGRPAKIDLGLVNTQKFIMSAGLGIDGSVTQNVNTALKKHIHRAAYIIEIFITLFLRRTPRHLVIADIPATTRRPGPVKKTRSLAIVSKSTLVMNTSNYAGRFVLSKNAAINDGLLDICIFRRTDIFFLFYSFFILLFYGPESFSKIPEIFIFQTSGLFIKTKGAPLQIDGDICYSDKSGSIINTPLSLQIKCLKNALNIMIPKA
jgi:diacylglycerol kinase family enzyme